MSDYINDQKEKLYASTKKEPLGTAYVRGHVLPEFTKVFTTHRNVMVAAVLVAAMSMAAREHSCTHIRIPNGTHTCT